MKICLIGTVASSTINFRKKFIQLLIQEGHEVYVFATDYSNQTIDVINSLGGKPISYGLSRGGLNPISDIKSMMQLKNKIKKIKPDIVFSYFSKPVIFGTLAAKIAKVPRIVGMLEGLGYAFTPEPPHEKESWKKKLVRSIQILLYKISFRYLDKIIFLNPDDPIDLLEKQKIQVKSSEILGPIGIELNKFNPSPPAKKPIRFIFIGRLLKEKGIIEYLKSAEEIKSIHPNCEFIVLGNFDKENPSSIEREYLNYYVNRNIIYYPGHVDSVQNWLEKSSIFVLPSYREGFSCSIQEAMACARPIITTTAPGCRSSIVHKKHGLLIESFSHVALSNAMIFLLENNHLLDTLSENSIKHARENFCATKQSQKLIKMVLDQ